MTVFSNFKSYFKTFLKLQFITNLLSKKIAVRIKKQATANLLNSSPSSLDPLVHPLDKTLFMILKGSFIWDIVIEQIKFPGLAGIV